MFGLKYEGANPGKGKWELVKIDDEKKKQKSKEYETKRTRVFCDSWSKDRKWLKFRSDKLYSGQVNFAGLQDQMSCKK
jgi:hypothetical protein